MADCIDMPSLLIYALRQATEAAARATYEWIGRGEKSRSDRAAVAAMRNAFDNLPIAGEIVIGDLAGEAENSLGVGTRVGNVKGPIAFDVAIDPDYASNALIYFSYAEPGDGGLTLRGLIARPDGSEVFETARSGPVADAEAMGRDAGEELRRRAGPGFFD